MTINSGYATLAEFKAWATTRGGTASTDSADDAVIEDIIENVSRWIDGQTGRRFYANSVDETRYFQPDEANLVEIDGLSAAPTSVSVDYDGYGTSYTALTVTTDYVLCPVNALLNGKPYTRLELGYASANYFPPIRNGVRIIGKFGFPSVPDNIKTDCLAVAHNIYQARNGQSGSQDVTVTAAGVVIRPRDVPAWVQADLARFRIIL